MTTVSSCLVRAPLALVLGALVLPAPVLAQPKGDDRPQVTIGPLANRRVFVSVANAEVSIRKEVGGTLSDTTITTATDHLRLRVTRDGLTVAGPAGVATLGTGRFEEVARLLAVLQRSDAAAKGRALLRALPPLTNDFGAHALLLTRAVLELAHGPSPALVEHRGWVEREAARRGAAGLVAGRPQAIRVQSGGTDRGPGECWDIYAQEAIRIAEDFLDCTDGLRWYDALGWAGCSLVYTIRSEAAMFWFLTCSGGFPFSG